MLLPMMGTGMGGPALGVNAIRKFPKMAFSHNLTYWPVV